MSEFSEIAVKNIRSERDRLEGGMGDIDLLARSIAECGLINPIAVRDLDSDSNLEPSFRRYEIIAGRRRLEAIKILGRANIPAIVYRTTEPIVSERIALAENANRLEMHPLDEGKLFKFLMEAGDEIDEISQQYDRSKSCIYQRVQLTKLVDEVKDLYRKDKIKLTHASMLSQMNESVQKEIAAFLEQAPYTISSFDISQAVQRFGGVQIGVFYTSPACTGCQTRTRYSDNTLFPELQDVRDFCLDHECYMTQLNIAIKALVIKTLEENAEHRNEINKVPYILVSSRTHPAIGQTIMITGYGFIKPLEVISWDSVTLFDKEELEDLDEETLAKLHDAIVIQGNTTNQFLKFLWDAEVPEEDDEDSRAEEEATVGMTAEQKEARAKVIRDGWNIDRMSRSFVMSRVALSHFSTEYLRNNQLFYILLDQKYRRETITFVCKSYDSTLDDDIIHEDSTWLDRFDDESRRNIFLDCQLFELLAAGYVDFGNPVNQVTQTLRFLGEDPAAISEEIKAESVKEINRRIQAIVDAPQEASGDETTEPDNDWESQADDDNDDDDGEEETGED